MKDCVSFSANWVEKLFRNKKKNTIYWEILEMNPEIKDH